MQAAGFKAFPYGDDPVTWPGAFDRVANVLGLKGDKVSVEPRRLRYLEIQYLRAAFPEMELVDGGPALDALRIHKDEMVKVVYNKTSACMF